jgi:ABC-type nitrate/sulfonate/bicarbonate transport system permease component
MKGAPQHGSHLKLPPLHRFTPVIGVLLFGLGWHLLVLTRWINPILLPCPIATLQTFWQLLWQPEHNLALDGLQTLIRTLFAFAIAAILGIPAGILLGSSVTVYRSVEFLIDFFRSLPASTLIPIFLLLFGLSEANKIVGATFSASLAIIFNSAYGVMQANPTRILTAKVMGADRWHVFKDVLFWESLPQTFMGLRMGISLALVFVTVAEMLTGTSGGLGKRILDAQQVLQVTEMYAAILFTGLIGYSLNMGFLRLEKKLIHWHR